MSNSWIYIRSLQQQTLTNASIHLSETIYLLSTTFVNFILNFYNFWSESEVGCDVSTLRCDFQDEYSTSCFE